METRGLVTREPCEDDARGLMVRMTDRGRAAIEAAAPEHVETVRRYFFDPLSRADVEELDVLFDKLLTALSGDPDRPAPRPRTGPT
jgi:DNA-binding MarR family transcriptional regulator